MPEEMSDVALYEFMFDRKWVRGLSWQQISDYLQLGISDDGCQKKYKRLVRKLGVLYKPVRRQETELIEEESMESRHDRVIARASADFVAGMDTSGMSDFDIINLTYGMIQPTMLVSELNHDDWIDKYMIYDYEFDDPEGMEDMTDEEWTYYVDVAIGELKREWRQTYLTNMRNEVWDNEELLVLFPRGYGKTETMIALFIRWFLEIRKTLYIVGPSWSHNRNLMRRIEALIKSPAVRRDYGDIIDRVSYDREMLTLTYHPEIQWMSLDSPVSMVTWQGAKEGPHPAWIHFEDVMQKEYKNIESNEDIKYKYNKTFAKMRTRRGGRRTKVTITGTRYGMEDMYSYFHKKLDFPLLHERALNEDGTWLYCPNYTLEDLENEKEKDVPSFETSMNNNPIPSSGVYFKEEAWIATEYDLKHEQGVQYYMVLDPARGVSELADNSALLVIAIHNGTATVVDGYVGKMDDDAKGLKIDQFYGRYSPIHSVIEKTFAQIDMNRFRHIRGLVPYQDTVKAAKIMRINAMKPYFTDGLIHVLKGIQPYDFLYQEYLSYNEKPSTPYRKDDSIDALSMIIQLFGKFLEKYIKTQIDYASKELPDFHLTPQ